MLPVNTGLFLNHIVFYVQGPPYPFAAKLLCMKKLILLLPCLYCTCLLQAQNTLKSRKEAIDKVLFSKGYVGFSLITQWVQKANTKHIQGPYKLGASNTSGVELGLNYYRNFNKKYTLVTGIHAGASGRTHKLFIRGNDFTPPLSYDVEHGPQLTRIFDLYLSVPVWLQRNWVVKHNRWWYARAGINIRYFPDEISESSFFSILGDNIQRIRVLEIDLEIFQNFTPWVNYNIGGGHTWLLRNNNLLQVGLLANFSATELAAGEYFITVPGKPLSRGEYGSKMSYLGLSLNYIFTRVNRKLSRLYEKELNLR